MEASGGGVAVMSPKVSEKEGSKGADPQLVEAASKFVSEVIEKAKEEAGRRRAQQKRDNAAAAPGARTGTEGGDAAARKAHSAGGGSIPGGAIPWHSRARGLISRLLSSFCFRGTTAAAAARSETPKNS